MIAESTDEADDNYQATRVRLADRLRSVAGTFEEVALGRGQRTTAFVLDGKTLVIPRVQLTAKLLGKGGSCYWFAFDQKIVAAARARYSAIAAAIICGDADHVIILAPTDLDAILAGPPRQRTRGQSAIWDPLIERRGSGESVRWILKYWDAHRVRTILPVNSRLNAFELLTGVRAETVRQDPLRQQRERLVRRVETLEESVAAARAQAAGDDSDRAHNLSAIEEHETALRQLQALDAEIAAIERAREGSRPVAEANQVVDFGSEVSIRDGDGAVETYTVVSPGSALPGAGWVSTASPLGRALLGHRAGETVAVQAPGGAWHVTIVTVSSGHTAPDRIRAV